MRIQLNIHSDMSKRDSKWHTVIKGIILEYVSFFNLA
jgi:hypothetical protein